MKEIIENKLASLYVLKTKLRDMAIKSLADDKYVEARNALSDLIEVRQEIKQVEEILMLSPKPVEEDGC